jgi:hypothetical protein
MKTVSIVSCGRAPSYLYQTLNGFQEPHTSVELIFQGQESLDVVETVLGSKPHPGEPLSETIAALCFNYECDIPRVYRTEKLFSDVQLNGQYNYAEALLHTRDGLILEDDVQVSKSFMAYVREVEELVPDDKTIVALYSFYSAEEANELKLVPYPIRVFANTQAMLYPLAIAREFGKYLLDTFGRQPYDMALRSFCLEKRIKLFATNYSLVQHMGNITTGLGYHHQATNFIDDYNCSSDRIISSKEIVSNSIFQ